MKPLISKEYPPSHLMNRRRPYANAVSTDITQSDGWRIAEGLRNYKESMKNIELVEVKHAVWLVK